MIANVPDAQEMKQLAIRAYFVAWKEAVSIIDLEGLIHTGSLNFEFKDDNLIATPNEYHSLELHESEQNLREYEKIMQSKLHLIFSLIQHSQELALKSHLCEKSPFLLLLGSDVKSWARENADFMDFKTIDASDLTKVVTAICNLPISHQFKNIIEQVRRGRNAIQHLGKHKELIGLIDPIKILTQQYIELFPARNWLKDFLQSEASGLDQLFVYDDFGSKTVVLRNLDHLHTFTTRKVAKRVLGVAEDSSLYKCAECISDAHYADTGFDTDELLCVERRRGSLMACCRLCDAEYTLKRQKCSECGCDVAHEDGSCFSCEA